MEAVIFDFDGTLVETSHLLYMGYKEVFSKYSIDYSENEFNSNYGLKTKQHLNTVLKKREISLSDKELNKLVKLRDKFCREKCENDIDLLFGARKFLEELNKNNIIMGIASSVSRQNLEFFIKKLKIQKYFSFYIGGDEVSKGKPNPEGYLRVCKSLNVNPKNCVGVEDTDKGINALVNAKMKAIAITLTNRKKYDFSNADLVINNWKELNLSKVQSLVS